MTFVKVFAKDNEIIDLNVSLILKVEKCKEGFSFERAIITDVLGNRYKSLATYKDFFTNVRVSDTEVLEKEIKEK